MRLRLRWILIAILFAGLAFHFRHSFSEAWTITESKLRSARFEDKTQRTTAFRIADDAWVTFKVPDSANQIRALTNAALFEVPSPDIFDGVSRPGWRYTIQYQLLDADEQLIHEDQYHLRSNITQFRDTQSDQLNSPSFFRTGDLVPIQTRTMTLSLARFADANISTIRLRLAAKDPAIADVVTRLMVRKPNPRAGSGSAWTRLSLERRKRVSRFNVYTPDLISPAERESLVRSSWHQAIPVGVSQRNFEPRVLYTRDEMQGEEVGGSQPLPSLIATPDIRATIPVPPGSGTLAIGYKRLDLQAAAPETKLHVSWFGRGAEQIDHTVRVTETESTSCFELDGGLIEIVSEEPIELTPTWTPTDQTTHASDGDSTQPVDLSASVMRLVTSRLAIGSPVIYSIYSDTSDVDRTAFRFTIRRAGTSESPEPDIADAMHVHWTTHDPAGNTLTSGTVTATPEISTYDYIASAGQIVHVTEPANFYLNMPPNVASIELRADEPLLVNAHTRTSQSIAQTSVPDDMNVFARRESMNVRWFPKRPVQHKQLRDDDRLVSVRVQARPPERDERILAGEYDWEDFRPAGDWLGRFVLQAQADAPLRPEAIPASYWKLLPNQPYDVYPVSDSREAVKPKLIYAATGPGRIRVELNGQVVLDQEHQAATGELFLPEIRTADSQPRTLTVFSDSNVKLFVGYLASDDAPRYLKRLVQIPRSDQLSFTISKQTHEKEHVLLRAFFPEESEHEAVVDVKLQTRSEATPVPSTAWTFRNRRFAFATEDSETVFALHAQDGLKAATQAAFITLGEDLPPGEYTVSVKCDDRARFMLYRTTPKRSDRMQLYSEQLTSK